MRTPRASARVHEPGRATPLSHQLAHAAAVAFAASVPLDVWAVKSLGSTSTVAGLALTVFGLLHVLARGSVRRTAAPIVLLVAFAVWSWLSLLWSWDTEATVLRAAQYTQLAFALWMLWQLTRTQAEHDHIAAAFLAGAFAAALGTYQAFADGDLYAADGRYATAGFDPNDLGLTLALGLSFSWHLATRRTGVLRWLAVLYAPVATGAIILTASRGAFLAAAAGALVLLVGLRRMTWRRRLILFAAGTAAAMVLAQAVPDDTWARLWTIREQMTGGTLTHRTTIWRAGIALFADNWLLGVGAGAFPHAVEPVLQWRIAAHNTFLGVAVEVGLVGLTFFLGAFAALVLAARRSNCGVPLLALLATWGVGAASLTWDYRKATWLLIAVVLSGATINAQRAGRIRTPMMRRETPRHPSPA